jgi:quercetin dioxygenase-like cupin family protein
MALSHSHPEHPIDARPLGERLAQTASHALLKTRSLELMRLVLRAGEALPPHTVDAEATLHCIEGAVQVRMADGECRLEGGMLVLIPAGRSYAVRAADGDASLLVTMLLPFGGSASATSPG